VQGSILLGSWLFTGVSPMSLDRAPKHVQADSSGPPHINMLSELKIPERCRIHASKMDEEGWYVTANVLHIAATEIDTLTGRLQQAEQENGVLKLILTDTPGALTVNCLRGSLTCSERSRLETERDMLRDMLRRAAMRFELLSSGGGARVNGIDPKIGAREIRNMLNETPNGTLVGDQPC
jgi:hypothetical protein